VKELQKKVEDADLENVKDAFGDNEALFGSDTKADSTAQSSLDTFKPNSEKDFSKYADMLAAKITTYAESYHYPAFLKNLLRDVTMAMDPDDIKELVTALNVIANEKIAASKKKKAAPKKKAPTKMTNIHEDIVDDEYDIFS